MVFGRSLQSPLRACSIPLQPTLDPIVDLRQRDRRHRAGGGLPADGGWSACIPIPSEAVMLFAGFSVSDGDQTLLGIVAGLAGNMVGSWRTYAIGYYGRLDLLEKNR
jgi:hypothetical protein